jgi:threonylcarbamoyladenosine tRNA methylthiotransferase MtaB
MHAHPTIAFATLGCRTNQAETAQLVASLAEVCAVVPFGEPADVSVINTCTVTHEAHRQSRQLVRRAHRANPAGRLVVTGCAVDLDPAGFEALPGVSLVARNAEKHAIAEAVAAWFGERSPAWRPVTPEESGHTRAFLKVSEGCNNRCSFCIVPMVRGSEQGVPMEVLVERAIALSRLGYQEIVLTGTHIGGYGRAFGASLATLLKRLLTEVPEVPRWRIASIEPLDFPDDLVALMAEPRVCPHVHLCLQSGSTRILNAMRRRYTADRYRSLVERIRTTRPDVAVTTDVIVGFPGETEADFAETLAMIAEVRFAGVHLFPFSVRAGTHAEGLPDRIPSAIVGERMEQAQAIARTTQNAWQDGFIGRRIEVLTERASAEWRPATSAHGLRVLVPAGETSPNQLLTLRIERGSDGALFGAAIPRRSGGSTGDGQGLEPIGLG